MAKLKAWMLGLIIGVLLGLWGGVNIGKGKPLYTNPFAEGPVSDKLKDAGRDVMRESGDALKKTGEALIDRGKEESER